MVLSFFEISDIEKERFSKAFKNYKLLFFEDNINKVPLEKYKNSDVLCTFIYSDVNKEVINNCPNLKIIATRSTGVNHINQTATLERGIIVLNVPVYGENTVAEHTFGLILSLSRKIYKSIMKTNDNNFKSEAIQGFDLKGKTIGIIGGGKIGLHVARMAKAFSMNVIIYDLNEDSFLEEILDFKYVNMDYLLKNSDIISLHVPYNAHTHHIINKESLDLVKSGSIIINTARGGLIDTEALLAAIDKGKVSGAGLDVIEGEEFILEETFANPPSEHAASVIKSSKKLLKNENVLFTPHNAFNSIEAVDRIINTTIKNIKDTIEIQNK